MSVFFDESICFPVQPLPKAAHDEFVFSAMHLDHGHLIGMVWGLVNAGGTLKSFYDPDSQKQKAFLSSFPQAHLAKSEEEILNDPEILLVAAAAVTSERAALGIRVMRAGKDYLTAKAPMTDLKQLDAVRLCIRETGRKYQCFYSEHVASESAVYAKYLIDRGTIGKVLHVESLAPHRLSPISRPGWFFDKALSGGILCDLGSHQIEQYLYFTDEEDASVTACRTANYASPAHPSFEDFGDCMVTGRNGTTLYFRVDWFTPNGVRGFGDIRTFIVGTKGSIELRKTIDPAVQKQEQDIVILLDESGEHRFAVHGIIPLPYFNRLIQDTLHRTETAMPQERCLKAAELCIKASQEARRIV